MYNDNKYEYEQNEILEDDGIKRKRLIKSILIAILSVIIVIIVFLLIKGCQSKSKDKYGYILESAKEYYQNDINLLPEFYGECNIVTLDKLLSLELIKHPKTYNNCEKTSSYVKVCKLESGKYHYTPVLMCDDVQTAFGDCIIGDEDKLEENVSNVEFEFKGYKLLTGIKKYYPNDETNLENVKAYFKQAPNINYNLTDDKGFEGYKWYTTVENVSTYWNNGAYNGEQPSGYPNKGKSKTTTFYSTENPEPKSYRVIESGEFTRAYYVARYKFKCIDDNLPGYLLTLTECDKRGSTTYNKFDPENKIVATCDDKTIVPDETKCGIYEEWIKGSCAEGADRTITGRRCEIANYRYTDTTYQWYVVGNGKKYYPSLEVTADKETTYYLESPIAGAIKDTSTKATVYRFYKFEEISNNDNNKEEWVPILEKFVTKEDLIEQFDKLNYNVKDLKDIKENEELKYEVQLKYCNRK